MDPHRGDAAWNERMAAKYDIDEYHQSSHGLIRFVERRRVRAVLDAVGGARVLEVGCGAGYILENVPEARLVGIDLSMRMALRTRERLAARGVAVAQADGERLPFRSGSFDGILCTEVLEHVPNPARLLDEIARVAAPGARVSISVPNGRLIKRMKRAASAVGLGRALFKGAHDDGGETDHEWHLHVFGIDELMAMLSARFSVREVIRVPWSVLPLRYVFSCSPT